MLNFLDRDLEEICLNTQEYWLNKKDLTFFITGGTGFFGIWFLMSFVHINRKMNLNSKFIILTRNKSKFLSRHPNFSEFHELVFVEGDIVDFKYFEEKVDYIIHAATEASVELNLKQPMVMFKTIVEGTNRVLDFARIKCVKGLLYVSSGAVYGVQPDSIENMYESFLGGPATNDSKSVYGESKRMAEVLCSVFYTHYGVPIKVARCYAFLGPFLPLDSHFAAGNFINNVLRGEDIVIKGDGSAMRSYMYPTDLLTWLWKILFKGAVNEPYNVGSDKSISIFDLAKLICERQGNQGTNVMINTPSAGQLSNRYVPSIFKAKEDLNLVLNVSLDEAIDRTVTFYKLRNKC